MSISKLKVDFEYCGDVIDVIRHQVELAKNLKVRLDAYHDQHKYMTAKLLDEGTEIDNKSILGLASAENLGRSKAEAFSEYLREETNSGMEAGLIISLNIRAFLSIAPITNKFFKEIIKA